MSTEYIACSVAATSSASVRLDSDLYPMISMSVSATSDASVRLEPTPYFSQTENHTEQALSHLLEQFKGKPIIEALLTCFVDQVQSLEDSLFDLLLRRSLDQASGEQLDGLGAILGEARQSRTDADFKRGIETRILINLDEATPNEIIEIMSRASGFDVLLAEYFPAAFVITILGKLDSTDSDSDGTPDAAARLYGYLDTSKPAGVGASLVYGISEIDELFRFDSGPGFDLGKYAGVI